MSSPELPDVWDDEIIPDPPGGVKAYAKRPKEVRAREEALLVLRWQENDDQRAAKALLGRHKGFIRKKANDWAEKCNLPDNQEERRQLFGYGCWAWHKSLDSWDPDGGRSVLSYAGTAVSREIKKRAKRRARELDQDPEVRLDAPLGDEDAGPVKHERTEDPHLESRADQAQETGDRRATLEHVLENGLLTDQEREAVHLAFPLDGSDALDRDEIGDALGVSQNRGRQVLADALDKLRGAPEVQDWGEGHGRGLRRTANMSAGEEFREAVRAQQRRMVATRAADE